MRIDAMVAEVARSAGLAQHPALLDAVLEAMDEHAIVAVTDRAGRILYANRKFCELSKYERHELIGQDHRMLGSGHHPRAFFKQLWTTIGRGRTWRGTFCNRAKDGSLYWVQSTIVPVAGADGRPSLYVALRTDVSELKAAELALGQSEQRFRNLFEQSADALLLLDIDRGLFIDANAAAARMLGYCDVAAVAGHAPAEFSPPSQPDGRASPEKAAAMMELARRQGSHRFEWWHSSPYREPFPVEVVLTVLKREAGTMVLTTWRDISERKRAEAWQAHYTGILQALVEDEAAAALFERILRFARGQAPAVRLAAFVVAGDNRRMLDVCAPDLPEQVRATPLQCPRACPVQDCPLFAPAAPAAAEADACDAFDCPAFEVPGLHLVSLEPIRQAADSQVLGSLAVFLDRPGPLLAEEEAVLRRSHDLLALVIARVRAREQQQLAEAVFRESQQAICVSGADLRVLAVNAAFARLCGVSMREAQGQSLQRFLPDPGSAEREHAVLATGRWQGEVEGLAADGRRLPLLCTQSRLPGGGDHAGSHIHVLTDLSDTRRQAERIERLAFYDELTQLPNRNLLKLRLGQSLQAARGEGASLALLCVDLDRFREVNETHGHSAGDIALAEVARRFSKRVGAAHLLARTGGDEFALLVERAGERESEGVAASLLHALQAPLLANAQRFALGASIGIALFPQDGASAEDLLRQADIALYRAKSAGGGHCFYREGMGADLARQLDLAGRLLRALEQDRLALYYQPLVDLRDGRLVGAEALLRWHEEDQGWISPGEFIPIAESRHMMPRLGAWVFRRACRQMREWDDAGRGLPRLAINLSARQFADTQLLADMRAALVESGLPASRFELELTESSIMADPDGAVRMMAELSRLGFSLAIDDFGTGYSSLSQLKRFPANKLKIDMSFVRDMLVDRNDQTIVETIVAMARTLRLETVAEGVETAPQAQALRGLGCNCAQGWYFAPALAPAAFFRDWL